MRSQFCVALLLCISIGSTASRSALAKNDEFQASFKLACAGSTGSMATLCAVPPAGSGEISGSSEDSLNPSQTLNAQEGTINRSRVRAQRIHDRLEAERGEHPGALAAAQARQFTDNLSLYVAGRGAWFDRAETLDRVGSSTSSGERGVDGTSGGLQLGGDYRIGDKLILGAQFTWDSIHTEFAADEAGNAFVPNDNAGEQDSDSYNFTFFGSFNFTDELFVDGYIGGGFDDLQLGRNGIFQEEARAIPTTATPTRSQTDGSIFTVGGGFGYDVSLGSASVGPYARVNYTRSRIDPHTESGGSGLEMKFAGNTRESLTTLLGFRASYAISLASAVIVPQLRVEWEHEYERDAIVQTASYVLDAAATTITTVGDKPDRNTANIGAGIAVVLQNGWMPYVDYQVLLGHTYWNRHRFTGGIRKDF